MRVGQLLTYVSRRRSGIFEFACGLSRRVAESGAESRVFGIRDEDAAADAPRWHPVTPTMARGLGPGVLGFAPGLLPAVLRADLDVLHAHGLWTFQSGVNLAWAARTRRPYVVSLHGMLNPLALRRSRARKRVASALYERRRLRQAACIHAVGAHETGYLRRHGVATAVAEVPYGIELPPLDETVPPPPWRDRIESGPRVLLYLGRLDPIKGLENLVIGWARARAAAPSRAAEWTLVIAGWGAPDYEALVRRTAAESGAGSSILFAGPLFAEDREAAYRAAEACVLPSLSEGMPVGVLEAWARARPVLMTDACHLPSGFEAGAAMRMDKGVEGAAAALAELFATSDADRRAMGARGRALIERRFSWPVVARQFLEVYGWLAGGGSTPACVRTD
jgi:poly(glycerol-phosphate) alpha-glucosyltransferase